MRNPVPLAALISLSLVLPAAAQSGGSGGGGSGATGTGPSGASAGVTGLRGGPSTHTATSHAEVARRLMARAKGQAAPPAVAAAEKESDAALQNDPTVKAMVNGSMAQPPSLAGGLPGVPPPPR